MSSRVDQYASHLDSHTVSSVRSASALKVVQRREALAVAFIDPETARSKAEEIKQYVLDNLEAMLTQLEERCRANGIVVHHAKDATEANARIVEICRRVAPEGGAIAKAKSMATEEIHLNKHLEEAGYQPVETDLGEFVVQLDHDTPSHIVTPIIHKRREQVAKTFEREHLGAYTEVPEELAKQAREYLRAKFREAKIGVSGVNFAIASTGRLVLVENEGNNRYSTTAPRVHIAIMGIEKMLPDEQDLALFLPLLACSATGQQITTYVHFISGPRKEGELDGPEEVHLILLDNGRRKVLGGPYREILRCIRCGACLNVCPVYRQSSGHGYGHVYSGPLGAVLAPALEGVEKMGDLAKASSLCGACQEVCPVKIPIPDMLLQLRDEAFRKGVFHDPVPWSLYSFGARRPWAWRLGLKMLPLAESLPSPAKASWSEYRSMPKPQGSSFREWWKQRQWPPSPGYPPPTLAPESGVASAKPEVGGGEGGWGEGFRTPAAASSRTAKSPTTDPPTPQLEEKGDLWHQFERALGALGGRMVDGSLLEVFTTHGLWVDPCLEEQAGLKSNVPTIWDAEIGISKAEFAIARTGTLVLKAGEGRHRLSSLVPPINIIVVGREQIVPTLEEAMGRLPNETTVFVTGPSRTADIEGVLVRGVHGPAEVLVYVQG